MSQSLLKSITFIEPGKQTIVVSAR